MKRIIYFILLTATACSSKPSSSNQANEQSTAQTIEQEVKPSPKFVFSVSKDLQVEFSKGNLQYQASTKSWRFASKQTEYIGKANTKLNSTYTGWIDLFAWGTSGYAGQYPETGTYNDITSITDTYYDWGIFNEIIQGNEKTTGWRTLSLEEWQYLLEKRTNAAKLLGCACINNEMGLVILPDNFVLPENVTFITNSTPQNSGDPEGHYFPYNLLSYINKYDSISWDVMEKAGAIFLPAAGIIQENHYEATWGGSYWSSTSNETDDDYSTLLGGNGVLDFGFPEVPKTRKDQVAYSMSSENRNKSLSRMSVRLVRNVQATKISFDNLAYVSKNTIKNFYVEKIDIGFIGEVPAERLIYYDESNGRKISLLTTTTGENMSSIAGINLHNDIKTHIKSITPLSEDLLSLETINKEGNAKTFLYYISNDDIIEKIADDKGISFYKKILYEEKEKESIPISQETWYVLRDKENSPKKLFTTSLRYYGRYKPSSPTKVKPLLPEDTISYYLIGGNINIIKILSSNRVLFSSDCPDGGCNWGEYWIYDIKENKASCLNASGPFIEIRKEDGRECIVITRKTYHDEGGAYYYEGLFDLDGRYIKDGKFLYE